MTEKQKRRIGRFLRKKRDDLRWRHMARHARISELESKSVGDFIDNAQKDEIIGTQHSLEERELSEIRLLARAQKRLSDGGFGTCQVCGGPIRMSRLLHLPETDLCYSCAIALERQKGMSLNHLKL